MIDELLVEICRSLEHQNYRVALISTLNLPLICGNVAYPSISDERRRYTDWYRNFVRHEGPLAHLFTPEIAYDIRGEMLHRFRTFRIIPAPNSSTQRIPLQFTKGTELLVEPSGEHAELMRRLANPHMERRGVGIEPDVFMVCPATYCAEVVTGAQIWLDGLTHDEESRLSNMFTIYEASGRPDPMPHPSVVAQAYGRPKG